MGTDTATYRARIGLFSAALRLGCPRRTGCKITSNGSFELHVDAGTILYLGIFLLHGTVCTELNTGTFRSCRVRLTRASAKAGMLGLILGVSLLLACVTKPCQTPTANCDFSQRLLRSGDISENPGPGISNGTQTDDKTSTGTAPSEIAEAFEALRSQMYQANESLTSMLSDKLDSLQNDMMNTRFSMQWLCEQQEHLKQSIQEAERRSQAQNQQLIDWIQACQTEQYEIKERLAEVTDEFTEKLNDAERQREHLELLSVRNNIRLFGVREERRETYWNCLNTVVHLLREAVPDIDWQTRDIVRVQRLGPRSDQQGRPRPVLVAFATWSDKLALLQRGREGLRSRGVRVSGELTRRQAAVLRDLRSQGRVGYFKNNRLLYRDNQAHNFSSQAPRRTPGIANPYDDQGAAEAPNNMQGRVPGRRTHDWRPGSQGKRHPGQLDPRTARWPRERRNRRIKINENNLITLSSAELQSPTQPDQLPDNPGSNDHEINDPPRQERVECTDEGDDNQPPATTEKEKKSVAHNKPSSIFCGSTQLSLESRGRTMHVQFNSITSTEPARFRLRVRLQRYATSCEQGRVVNVAVVDSAQIQSPNFPDPYPERSLCRWRLRSKTPHPLRYLLLSSSTFQLGPRDTCASNYVKVYDGPDSTARMVAHFCTGEQGGVRASNGTLFVEFRSDDSTPSTGFKVDVHAEQTSLPASASSSGLLSTVLLLSILLPVLILFIIVCVCCCCCIHRRRQKRRRRELSGVRSGQQAAQGVDVPSYLGPLGSGQGAQLQEEPLAFISGPTFGNEAAMELPPYPGALAVGGQQDQPPPYGSLEDFPPPYHVVCGKQAPDAQAQARPTRTP